MEYPQPYINIGVLTRSNKGAFYDCSSLQTITIGSSVKSIEKGDNYDSAAFYGCDKLANINYLGTIESWCKIVGLGNLMGYGASKTFSLNGEAVTDLVIPDTVTTIPSSAFYGCSSLTSVTIGNSVTSIGNSAFYNCSSLKTVYYAGTADDWAKIDIGDYNYGLFSATRYYYSETKPALNSDGTAYDGNYWHYDNGEVVIWTK